MRAASVRNAVRQAFGQGNPGTAMVEFALTAPVLLIVVLGVADVAATTIAKFKCSNATQSGADLATQSMNLQTSDMVNVFAGAADVMMPFSSSPLLLRITSVASNGSGSIFVHWSCGQGLLSPYTAKSSFNTLPNGDPTSNVIVATNFTNSGITYTGTNTTIVVVESRYDYTPPTRFILKSTQSMISSFVTYARQSAYVGFPWDGNTNDQPTAPASTTRTASVTLSNGAVCNYAY